MARVRLKAPERARLTLWLAYLGPDAWKLTQRQLATRATEQLGFTVTVDIASAARKASVLRPGPEPGPPPVRASWWRRLRTWLSTWDDYCEPDGGTLL